MKKLIYITAIIVVIIGIGIAYWYFFMKKDVTPIEDNTNTSSTGFKPINRNVSPNKNTQATSTGSNLGTTTQNTNPNTSSTNLATKLPALRMLSSTPVGGATLETISTTTLIRFIDRGRGNIYEASNISSEIKVLSNTILPKVYESVWNKNMNVFIALSLSESTDKVSALYSTLQPRFSPKQSVIPTKGTKATTTIDIPVDTSLTLFYIARYRTICILNECFAPHTFFSQSIY
jgi:hypothetical protein